MKIHPDFNDFVGALNENEVEFVIVGAYALAFLGYPRATGDIDFWVRPNQNNGERLLDALREFGFGDLEITIEDLISGKIIQLGYPPVRIDIISKLTGLSTKEIWANRQKGSFGNHTVYYLGRSAYVKNKKALARHKDLADLELLGEQDE